MKRHNFAAGFILAGLLHLGMIGPLPAGEMVPFKGDIDGSYTVTINPGPPPTGTFVGSGEGQATHLGQFTYEFPHTVNLAASPPAGQGTYSFKAANGDSVEAEFTGFSMPVEPGFVFVVEAGNITGGTGRFAGATGEFTIMRLVDQVNGTTTGSFSGTISSPGANKR